MIEIPTSLPLCFALDDPLLLILQESTLGSGGDDPLADIPYLRRIETHRGDKALNGIASENSPNPEVFWNGEPQAWQSVGPKQPVTRLHPDGTPCLDFDGVDDFLEVGVMGGQVTYTVLFRSKTHVFNAYWSLLERTTGHTEELVYRWGYFEFSSRQFGFHPAPASVRWDGVEWNSQLSAPSPINEYRVVTVTTPNALAVPRGIGQLEQIAFGNFELIAFFIYDGTPTLEQIERVEAHHRTLRPDPMFGRDLLAYVKTHNEDDNSPINMFLDEAATIPAISEDDQVAAYKCVATGRVYAQDDPDRRPRLKFVNGTPVLRFEAGQFLTCATFPTGLTDVMISIGCRLNVVDGTEDIPVGIGQALDNNACRLLYRPPSSYKVGYATWANDWVSDLDWGSPPHGPNQYVHTLRNTGANVVLDLGGLRRTSTYPGGVPLPTISGYATIGNIHGSLNYVTSMDMTSVIISTTRDDVETAEIRAYQELLLPPS